MDNETSSSPAFDLKPYQNADVGTFIVRDQSGDDLLYAGRPVRITVHGLGSKTQVAAERKQTKAAKLVLYAGIRGQVSSNGEEEEFKRDAEYLAACTVSVENFPIPGGALAIYSDPRLGYIKKQVQEFLGNAANFKPGSGAI